jgi:hypothetical protein
METPCWQRRKFFHDNIKCYQAKMDDTYQEIKNTKNFSNKNSQDWVCLDFLKLVNDGFAICRDFPVKVLITIRGMCMVDVFDMNDFQHAAFLDFDLSRPAALDSAFVSPFIGLPFNAIVHRTLGRTLTPFDDLRKNTMWVFLFHPTIATGVLKASGTWMN